MANVSTDLNATFTYDNEARMTNAQYPTWGPSTSPTSGPALTWTYDSMGRLSTVNDGSITPQAATYGPSSELLSMNSFVSETRTYNSMLQLTNLVSNGVNITYAYSTTQNNGKIISQTDNISGEQVTYTYDALNRLATAQATNNSWGQSFAYDGFGNLTDQNVTAGSAPSYHVVPNAATNHLGGEDANGNAPGYTYDIENRIVSAAGYQYAYAPGNKRLIRSNCCTTENQTGYNFPVASEEITFWSVTGQRMATYQLAPASYSGTVRQWAGVVTGGSNTISVTNYSGGISVGQVVEGSGIPANTTVTSVAGSSVTMSANATVSGTGVTLTFLSTSLQLVATQSGTWYYFGGKLVKNKTGPVGADRLGSIGKYYPYGQEKPSATTNGTEKFTGYFRDSETGLDYADQRYHNPGTGRFLTVDPLSSSSAPATPLTWDRYVYVNGDPINLVDHTGTCATFDGIGNYFGLDDGDDEDGGGCGLDSGGGAGGGISLDGSITGCTIDGISVPCYMAGIALGSGSAFLPGGGPLGSGSAFLPGGGGAAIGAGGIAIGEGVCIILEPCGGAEVIGAIIVAIGAVLTNAAGDTKDVNKVWPPCNPPAGTIAYRLDKVPPSRPHFPFKGDHVHLYIVNQDPSTGKCYWNNYGVTAPPPPPGAIPYTGIISGGTNP